MPHTVLATFRVRAGSEFELSRLLDRHWQLIFSRGLGEGPDPVRFIRRDPDGPVLLELFEWRDGGLNAALQDKDVRDIWAAIDQCCEQRAGQPQSEFPAVERIFPLPSGRGLG